MQVLANLGKALQAQSSLAAHESVQIALIDATRLGNGELRLARIFNRLTKLIDNVLLHATRASSLSMGADNESTGAATSIRSACCCTRCSAGGSRLRPTVRRRWSFSTPMNSPSR